MNPASNRLRFFLDILLDITKDLAMGVGFIRDLRLTRPRTSTELEHTSEFLERYSFSLLREILKCRGSIAGLRVTEFGPGDHIATGLAMLAAGASSYTSLDRFPGPYGSDVAKKLYRSVKTAWPSTFPEMPWPAWLDVVLFPEGYPDRVKNISVGVELVTGAEPCDLVCSYVVGEHVSDLAAFARVTSELLAPGGIAVHVVDFSQHSTWGAGDDPFMFLRFPDWLWRLMGSNRGLPNRFRYHEFEEAFASAGLDVSCNSREIAADLTRPDNLAARFRSMPIDSVKTLHAIFVCTKR
jgi:hypothetical protein